MSEKRKKHTIATYHLGKIAFDDDREAEVTLTSAGLKRWLATERRGMIDDQKRMLARELATSPTNVLRIYAPGLELLAIIERSDERSE